MSVAIGDLDSDGDPDIAVANFGGSNPTIDSGSVTVLKNNGGGSFLNSTDLGLERPTSVAIGDLDGDHHLDLAVSSTQSGPHVSVLLQQAGGVLPDAGEDHPVGASPRALAIADLNADGKPDLLTANEGADTVSVLIANDSGGFDQQLDVATGARPVSLAVADLNLDGVPDLATANDSGTVSVLPGVGNGTFLTREDIPNDSNPLLVPGSPAAIAAADWLFAHDGRPDLVVAGGGANRLDVLVNASGPDTPPGSNVVVTPVDRNTGLTPVTITFDVVSAAGVTMLKSSASGPPAPSRFDVNGSYYYLETTAAFTQAEVCFSYPFTAPPPSIVHWIGGVPVIESITRDTGSEVCAVVSSFSPFALAQPVAAEDTDAPVVVCGAADGSWHADNVSISCTAHDEGSGLADPAGAAFSLSTSVPAGAENGNASTGPRLVCDVAGNCTTAGPIGGNRIDRKAPTLRVPADKTVDATSPAGAVVSFTASATDAADPSPGVACAPASGSVFAIGSSNLSCTATDHVGNAAHGSFAVTVLGAGEQLDRLIRSVIAASTLPPAVKTQLLGKLQPLVDAFDPSNPAQRKIACNAMSGLITVVRLLSGHGIPQAQAAGWIADANRIKAVLGC